MIYGTYHPCDGPGKGMFKKSLKVYHILFEFVDFNRLKIDFENTSLTPGSWKVLPSILFHLQASSLLAILLFDKIKKRKGSCCFLHCLNLKFYLREKCNSPYTFALTSKPINFGLI